VGVTAFITTLPKETSTAEIAVKDCDMRRLVRRADEAMGYQTAGDWDVINMYTAYFLDLFLRRYLVLISLSESSCNASGIRGDLYVSCQPMPPTLTILHCVIQYCLSLCSYQGIGETFVCSFFYFELVPCLQ
jgi:hypothetical protein